MQVSSRLKNALLLGTKKALAVTSTHYQVSLPDVAAGYALAEGLTEEEEEEAMRQADAAAEDAAKTLASFFEDDLFPDADDRDEDAPEAVDAP
jgi:hypothetical protein